MPGIQEQGDGIHPPIGVFDYEGQVPYRRRYPQIIKVLWEGSGARSAMCHACWKGPNPEFTQNVKKQIKMLFWEHKQNVPGVLEMSKKNYQKGPPDIFGTFFFTFF